MTTILVILLSIEAIIMGNFIIVIIRVTIVASIIPVVGTKCLELTASTVTLTMMRMMISALR